MKIYIKNMVCLGTRYFVIQELEALGHSYHIFKSGVITFEKDLSRAERKKLDKSMQQYGLELNYMGSDLLSKIRHTVLDLVENHIAP
jgi:hypothetical protein